MVRIITDSAADFEPPEIKALGIECIPIKVMFGECEYQENVNLTKDKFYNMLTAEDEFPKTAQPSPAEFLEVLEAAKNADDECVIITLSSQLSGTYQNAVLSKEMAEYDGAFVVDGLSATGGQRLLVEHAVKLRDSGTSAKDIADEIDSLKSRVRIYAVIDTLEYLYKGGRISKSSYAIGSFVNIKPLITVTEGKVDVYAKELSVRRGIKNLCEKLDEEKPDKNYPMYIVYSHNRQNAERLAETIKDEGFDVSDDKITNIGATIGAHIGCNACGVVYVAESN